MTNYRIKISKYLKDSGLRTWDQLIMSQMSNTYNNTISNHMVNISKIKGYELSPLFRQSRKRCTVNTVHKLSNVFAFHLSNLPRNTLRFL